MTRWQVSARWMAVAVLTAPALVGGILWILSHVASPGYAARMQWPGLPVALLAGGLEEIGWTGCATPRLLAKRNWLSAGLVLGVVWALWHLLVAAFASNIVASWAGWLLWFGIFWLMAMTAYRILMTWVYSHTQNLFVAQLMHAGYTGSLVVLSPDISFTQGLLWQTLFAVGLWVMVAVVAISDRRRRTQDEAA